MKTHTSDYKQAIKRFGREIDAKIEVQVGSQTMEYGATVLNSIVPHFEGDILKSSMRQLDLDSNILIPKNKEIKVKFGVKVNGSYEYMDYGNYIVYSVERKEDTRSYEIVCYDKMLYAMKDYESLGVTYPISVRDFITALCTKIGLEFKNKYDTFVNYDKQIIQEVFLDSDGKTLGYTYRDVLDQLAEVTASTICINEQTDELEIRYPKNTGEYTTVEGSVLTLANVEDERDIELQLKGNTNQIDTPTPTVPINVEVVTGGQIVNECRKNIFDKSQSAIIRVSSSYTGLENGVRSTLTATGTNKFIGIRIGGNELLGKTLTVRSKITPSGSNTGRIRFYFIRGTATRDMVSGSSLTATGSVTFTIPNQFSSETDDGIAILLDSNRNGTNVSVGDYVDYTDLQIEISNQATEYEQYSGKDYEIDLGKNLIYNNVHTQEETFNEVKYTPNSDGSISVKGTATGDYNYYILGGSNNYPLILQPGTYTLSGSISSNAWVRLYDGTTYYDATTNLTKTFTILQTTRFNVRLRVKNGTTVDNTFYPMLEKGSTATSYRKHKEPIELCKIDTYQDRIFKNEDTRNICLTDFSEWESGQYNNLGSKQDAPKRIRLKNLLPVQPDTEYYFNTFCSPYKFVIRTYDNTGTIVRSIGAVNNEATLTTSSTEYYLGVIIYNSTSEASASYEVYTELFENGSMKPFICLNSETDKSYIPHNQDWYIEKQVKKAMLGVDITFSATTGGFYSQSVNDYAISNNTPKCTWYNGKSNVGAISGINDKELAFNQSSSPYPRLYLKDSDYSSATTLNSDLSTNNVPIYYALATPTYTKITDTELISQLESIRLLYGKTNVLVRSFNLSSPIKLTYASSLETLDEKFLKDVNVKFGEKYGKINSVVLSRSAESDNIYLQDEESIEENGLCEIKIADNQIMNFNDRADFLPDILEKLNGLYYYINDFTSTGITYLELCDAYKVKIGDTKYKCIMFNDQLEITQGLVEMIHTDMPNESETDYTYADKTDRRITGAYIIANKMEAEIEEVTNQLNETNSNLNTVITKQTATDRSISILSTNVDSETGEVNSVTTKEKKFTFNDEGLTITNSETNFKSKQDETGTYYYDGANIIGQYTKDGSKQKDLQLFGVYYYGMDEIEDTPMFITQLYTDENGEETVGHFYNGGDY